MVRLSKFDLKKIVKDDRSLKDNQKKFLLDNLGTEGRGLSEVELTRKMRGIRDNTHDPLNRREAEKTRQTLISHLEGEGEDKEEE